MALTDSEIQRIRFELGYPNMSTAAEPYIGIAAVFDAIVKPYTLSGTITTSSTPVTAATTPTPQTIVVAAATNMAVGNVLVVDVDARQERATIQSISGTSVTLQLLFAHTGTYPVTLEGGESIIRDILNELRKLSVGMNGKAGSVSALASRAGLKKVEDVEWFGGGGTLASQGVDVVTQTLMLREMWRDELANALGIPRLNDKRNSGGSDVSVY